MLTVARLPKAARPLVAAGQLVSPNHDQDAARNLALRMVTPPTARKPCLLEKVAGSTLMLCHTFPQERPTGRSGTASAGSGKSADAEDPSFSRQISWRLGRLYHRRCGADSTNRPMVCLSDTGPAVRRRRRMDRPRARL